jgi:hypothetical protein
VGSRRVETPGEFREAVAKKSGTVDLRIGAGFEQRPVLSVPPAVDPPKAEAADEPAK